ncbi:TetR/AcrR family transcriptional regulator [Vibrio sp. qd031]|uniref:TetR/AcrR family transcriptional regulator n=1 Tax=Vibrio sp. qd031 TaxID=1603038 RepID=UPI00117DC3F0|nr:TetR/AcrR family transcriptional regulator [Vibrio sp. qd031]
MHKVNTKEKIVQVAEGLFAEQGFNDTSLRAITSKADVNLASVNYHFGDKKSLIRAVLNQYLEAFMPALGRALTELEQQPHHDMQAVFEAIKKPLMNLNAVRDNGASRFMLLVGRGYSDVQGHLRWFITNHYDDVLQQFITAVHRASPDLTREQLFWRLHFVLGTCVFTMASSQALMEIAFSDFGRAADSEVIINQLIPFLAAGVSANN